MLLNDLHSIASTLLEYEAYDQAAILFRYSLEKFDPSNVAVRERLSASLRGMGELKEAASELYGVICTLEEEAKNEQQLGMVGDGGTLSFLYLDLGHLIEEIKPLPGSGSDWIEMIESEDDAPKFRLNFAPEVKEDITIMFGEDDEADEINDNDEDKGSGIRQEDLSAIECYRRALHFDSDNGLAHKRLADALAIIDRDDESLREFSIASELLPEDICCATHTWYAEKYDAEKEVEREALPMAGGGSPTTLAGLCYDKTALGGGEEALSSLAAVFERDGIIVFPSLLQADDCQTLSDAVAVVETSVKDNGGGDSTAFTDETRAAANRVHMSLPIRGLHTEVISNVFQTLYPLLKLLLCQKDRQGGEVSIPLLGSGFMRVISGASGQVLHKDVHHYDRHESLIEGFPSKADKDSGNPRCVSIQVQLTDTTTPEDMPEKTGSLEVLPGSHRPDAPNASPSCIEKAVKKPEGEQGVISIDSVPGTVTIYSSRLWHRGGPNTSDRTRTFCFFSATEPNSLAPAGLIHTLERADVGRWHIGPNGLRSSD